MPWPTPLGFSPHLPADDRNPGFGEEQRRVPERAQHPKEDGANHDGQKMQVQVHEFSPQCRDFPRQKPAGEWMQGM